MDQNSGFILDGVYAFKTHKKKMLADILTPIQIYVKLRDVFPSACLLESSDYHTANKSFSFIGFCPKASFVLENEEIKAIFPDQSTATAALKKGESVYPLLKDYFNQFQADSPEVGNGFFGYTSYDSVQYFESIRFSNKTKSSYGAPEIYLVFFQYVIVFDHFHNSITLMEHTFFGEKESLNDLCDLIINKLWHVFPFDTKGEIESNLTDEQYKQNVALGVKSCYRGDVFQIVLSRQFSQKFKGDEFNVYRTLRSINPSPYLFYFDFGNFKIFGSSPEAQLVVKNNSAYIDPIAGTTYRTGNDDEDKRLAKILAQDEKENAEHTMLVDLARNDLSRNSSSVNISWLKEVQYFSHVLHMVSRVEAKLNDQSDYLKVYADTFPAGTLSGAPKYKAMQLIDQYENQGRGVYGGAIGYFGLDGTINTAIAIRTFVSKNNCLFFQAGGGIVSRSDEEKELQESNNKLGALRKAIELAKKLN